MPKKTNSFAPIASAFQKAATARKWTLDDSGLIATSPAGWMTLQCQHKVVCAAAMPVLSRISIVGKWAKWAIEADGRVRNHDSACSPENLWVVGEEFQSAEALYAAVSQYEGLIEYPHKLTVVQARVVTGLQAGHALVSDHHRWHYQSDGRYTLGDQKVSNATVYSLQVAGILVGLALKADATARAEWSRLKKEVA